MRKSLQRVFRACTWLITLPLFTMLSCTDTWNDHYSPAGTELSDGTLWQAMQSDASLTNFCSVLQACGYDRTLSGSQTYTVFAPANSCLTADEAQSLISNYQEQRQAGVKDAENTVIRQFVQNHIALYRHSVSTLTNDSVALLNGKYKVLTKSQLADAQLLTINKTMSNGELFTIGSQVGYFPNVYEYLKMDAELDSVYKFLASYDIYEFQPSLSVAGSINEDGQTEYLDSVSVLSNSMLNQIGFINKEDSTYWFLAPTNTEWKRLYDEYRPYFNFASNVQRRDSLQETLTRSNIITYSCFNRTTNPDAAFQDSALCTQVDLIDWTIRRSLAIDDQGVYYKPFQAGGIFDCAEQVECSNGRLLKASDYRIDKRKTFFRDIVIEAEDVSYQDTLVQCESPLTVRQVATDNPYYDRISGNSFVDVIAKNTTGKEDAWPQPQVRFNVPNTLSNVPYDIYVVMAPVEAYNTGASAEDRLPNRFSGFVYYYNQDNKLQQQRISTKETHPGEVDSILVASGIKFPVCGVNQTNAVVKIHLTSQVARNLTSQYSNTMHIDCIVLKPKE